MVASAKKTAKRTAQPAAKPVTKATVAVAVKAARSLAVEHVATNALAKQLTSSVLSQRNAPPPKKKQGNRFTTDPDSVMNFAIKAGILTRDGKLTPSFG